MYLATKPQRSCARAWVAAASAILASGREAYNVVIDIEDPVHHDKTDASVILLVDSFLRERNQNRITTVANTIFPQAVYRKCGSPFFYAEYIKGFDALTKQSKRWGRYFERMIRHRTLDGMTYNPLQELINKIRSQHDSGRPFRTTHELAIYDPLLDRRYLRGGQCLSFLSFKLHPERGLTLTAIYRNHTYVTRCLGNLIGLGQLQAFVAKEARMNVGSLTCLSTHAELDVGKEGKWTLKDARQLIKDASRLLDPNASSEPSSGAGNGDARADT